MCRKTGEDIHTTCIFHYSFTYIKRTYTKYNDCFSQTSTNAELVGRD